MQKITIPLLIALFSLTLINCTQNLGRFSLASNKNISHLKVNPEKGKKVEASYWDWHFLYLFGLNPVAQQEAVENALSNAGSDYSLLVDVGTFLGVLPPFPFLIISTVKGTAYKKNDVKLLSTLNSNN